MKKTIIALVIAIIIVGGVFVFMRYKSQPAPEIPHVTLISPNDAAVLQSGKPVQIVWSTTGFQRENVYLVTTNQTGGTTVIGVITSIEKTVKGTRSFEWDAKALCASIESKTCTHSAKPGSYKIYITGEINGTSSYAEDMSDFEFTIK